MRLDVDQILSLPSVWIAASEVPHIVNVNWYLEPGTRSDVETKSRVGSSFPSENEHHGPFRTSEHAIERFFVRQARIGAVSWVSMHPDTGELLGPMPDIDLRVEQICNRVVVEGNVRPRTNLLD